MRSLRFRRSFYLELERRLVENKKLYGESHLALPDSSWARFVASWLGVNPWKVLVPISLLVSLVLRIIFGKPFTEFILRILGG